MTRRRTLRLSACASALALAGIAGSAPAADAASYDLAGLWLFAEGSGQRTYDLSFSGNHGQLGSTPGVDANDPTRIQERQGWFINRALRFDGHDWVAVPDAPSLEPDGVAVVAKVRSTGPGPIRYVVAKGALACETASYGLYTGAGGGLQFYVSDGQNYKLSADAGTGMWDGRWHTVVGAYDGTQLRLWVDGRLVASPVPASLQIGYGLPDDDNFYIGKYAGPCEGLYETGFQGDIGGVAVIGSYVGSGAGGLV